MVKMLLALLSGIIAASTTVKAADTTPFNWKSITPTADLQYRNCYGKYKCARLQLPLDWLNTTDKRTVAIAMTKLPATVSDNDASFGGSVFTNPGGPGIPGIPFMLARANQLRTMIDNNRHYEIVSFDPRGIGFSTPQSQCFQSALARDSMALQLRGAGSLDQGNHALRYNHAIRESYADLCQESDEEHGEIMGYAGTASVARDMVAMVDKIDELRRKTSKREEVTERGEKTKPDLPRLQYIGFSYGTILGNYFASMFPGRVGRMVLDGVSNSYDYSKGPGWLTSLVDTDKIYYNFFKGCYTVGSLVCVLRKPYDTCPGDIKTRVESYIARLDKSPLALQYENAPFILSGSDVRSIIALALYDPVALFPTLAYGLAEGIAGNPTPLVAAVVNNGAFPSLSDDCNATTANKAVGPGEEAGFAVICGDGDDVTSKDLAWWKSYVGQQVSSSRILGPHWSGIRFACSSWRFRANWRFQGPFTTPPANKKGVTGVPTAPLLFMSNRLDPVTPLSAAIAMRVGHPGSGLVVQETMGHTVAGMYASSCVDNILADYFEFGTVPPKVAYCQPARKPWDIGSSTSSKSKRSVGAITKVPSSL
ncbi:TAP-like protein-domain-containing protein [Ilyonectria robusta]|uniref:TAP-like protein-domain-containing protein n=1 Tax=Ilyonectria robusta TaxID=1079257 RepID=UPI001E8E4E11|nr:TAP-like protein-domain-containing protein [Ilyonectria robusta]KAH8670493.1 TAP-like protein-domain-containing protein [Ilyonectria robusta]